MLQISEGLLLVITVYLFNFFNYHYCSEYLSKANNIINKSTKGKQGQHLSVLQDFSRKKSNMINK